MKKKFKAFKVEFTKPGSFTIEAVTLYAMSSKEAKRIADAFGVTVWNVSEAY